MPASNRQIALRNQAQSKNRRLPAVLRTQRRLFLENLEERRVMAGEVIAALVGTELQILGDQVADQTDSIQIELQGGSYVVTGLNGTKVNGAASDSFANAAVSKISASLLLGTNLVQFSSALDPADIAEINGAAAANVLKLNLVDSAAHVVSLLSDVTEGYAGSTNGNIAFTNVDEITASGNIDDELKTHNVSTTWTINDVAGNSLQASTATLKFSGFRKLTGGGDVDTFQVQDNTVLSYALQGGAGIDQFKLGSAANKLDSVASLSVDGGVDSAQLTLNDQGHALNSNYSVTSATVGRASGGAVAYSNVTDITINAGGGNNKLTADASAAIVPTVTFNGGGQAGSPGDTLAVTGGTHALATLNYIDSNDGSVVLGTTKVNYTGLEPVDLSGTTITDLVLNLPDSDDAADDITKLSIAAGKLVVDSVNGEHEDTTISLTGITSITLNARQGDDAITLDKTLRTFAGAININGGNGDDLLTIDLTGGAFDGDVNFIGGAGTDKLALSGGTAISGKVTYPNATDVEYEFGSGSVTPTVVEQIQFTGTTFSSLTINLPDSDDASDDDTKFSIAAGNLVIDSQNGEHRDDSVPFTGVTSLTINGRQGDDKITLDKSLSAFAGAGGINVNGGDQDDTLTVNLNGTDYLATVNFNGDGQTSSPNGDKLVIAGGTHTNATLNYTNANDGSVILDGNKINYTGLEPIDITGTTITNLVLNLPDSDEATDDDTELRIAGGNLVVDSKNGEHEDTVIALTGIASIVVNGRKGDDKIELDGTMKAFAGATGIVVNGGDQNSEVTVDFSGGAYAATVSVNGGAQSTADKLTITGGTHTTVKVNHADADDGSVELDDKTITFTGIEALNLTGTTITNLILNLPNTNDAVDDDTQLSVAGTDLVVDSKNGEHSDSTISLNGIDTIIVNGRGGDDKITLAATMKDFAGSKITLNGDAQDDRYVVNFSAGPYNAAVTVNGGAQGVSDRLNIVGGTHTTVKVNFTNATDGTVNLDAKTITYTGIESLDIGSTSITNLEFNLPNVADDTELSISGGTTLLVDSKTNVHTDTTASLTGVDKITVNGNGGVDLIELDRTMKSFAGSKVILNGNAQDDRYTIDVTNGQYTTKVEVHGSTQTTSDKLIVTGGTHNTVKVNHTNAGNGSIELDAQVIDYTGIEAITISGTTITDLIVNLPDVDAAGADDDTKLSFGANLTVDSQTSTHADDTISLNGVNTVTVNARQGEDKVTIDSTISAFTKALTVDGGAQDDIFNVDSRVGAGGSVTIKGSTGNDLLSFDTFKLGATNTAVDVRLEDPANAAQVFKGNARALGDAASFLSFEAIENAKGHGTLETDVLTGRNVESEWTLNITGSSNPAGELNTYKVIATGDILNFSEFETLNGGSDKDTFKVEINGDMSASETFTLNGKDGSDTFLIGKTNSLLNIKSLKLDGGVNAADTDELILNDSAQATDETYNLAPTSMGFEASTITPSTAAGFNVESIKLNSSTGTNKVNITDGTFSDASKEATITLIHPANGKLTDLSIGDAGDAANNTWSITSTKTERTIPVQKLTIDYTSTALSSYKLEAGTGSDSITINSTAAQTSVGGNAGNDTINVNAIQHATNARGGDGNDTVHVAQGDLDTIAAALTVSGGNHLAAPTRTVYSGGTKNASKGQFSAASSPQAQGDSLFVHDSAELGLTDYGINNTTVNRVGAANAVNYNTFELLGLEAGAEDSDIVITMNSLPTVVTIDGGGGADDRLQIKGTAAADKITIGDLSVSETNRSQFEVTSITRMWVEGNGGADTIHNRTLNIPALLDGDKAKTSNVPGANQGDTIVSDALSSAAFSSVLLGNDGADYLHTTNNSATGTTYLVGDYFINPSKENRIQVTFSGGLPGEKGDIYATRHTPVGDQRNHVLARRDVAANSYFGNFANLTADSIGNNLTVINWLRGRLPLTITKQGIAGRVAEINFHVRQFTRAPGDAPNPAPGSQTYRPGGSASPNPNNWSQNGGESVEDVPSADVTTVVMTNPYESADVNGDGKITAFDALTIINELNRNGAHKLDTSITGDFGVEGGGEERKPIDFLDVNRDGSVSALDALSIINKLNLGQTTYNVPTFDLFTEVDAAEAGSPNWIAEAVAAAAGSADSLTDEALLALLASETGEEE